MRRRLTADGSSSLRRVSESCHHSPSTGPRRPSVSIALRSFWLIARTSAGPVAGSLRTEVSPSRSLGSFEPFAWRMNVRRMPSAPPNSPASNTTLSRGDAWPDASVVGQHERREIDLLGELDEPVEGRPPRVERGRPGLDVGDLLEPARDCLKQFGLLARRPEEDARLVHARFTLFGQETRASVLDSTNWRRHWSARRQSDAHKRRLI